MLLLKSVKIKLDFILQNLNNEYELEIRNIHQKLLVQ